MAQINIDQRTAMAIQTEILRAIEVIVDRYVEDPEQRSVLKAKKSTGYKVGDYIIQQIPYADLNDIKFSDLPGTSEGDDVPDPNGQTYDVQKYGVLAKYHTDDPYITGTTDDEQEAEYRTIPVGFPVAFAQRKNNPTGFDEWRFHNGVKAIRIEYKVFSGRPIEKLAHLIVFYSGGDH